MRGYPEEAQEHAEELAGQDAEEKQEWLESLAAQAVAEGEVEEDVNYPICPLMLFFEGDDIDIDKCDYDMGTRTCSMKCIEDKPELKRLYGGTTPNLNPKKTSGSGITTFQTNED